MSLSTLSMPVRELLLRVRWHGRRLVVWGGWYLPVGVAALGCAALLILAAREQRDAAARLQAEAPAAAARTAQGETAALPFPRGEAAVRQMMGQVFKLAEGAAVSLAQGEYKRLSEEDAPILRYEMQVPVTGELPAIRKFIAKLLSEHPTLALEGVSLTRESVEDPVVEARLNFVFYYLPG